MAYESCLDARFEREDQATASSSNQLEKLNQQFTDMYASRAKYFKAYSSVRDSQVGYWFNLQEHPEIDQHEGADQEFLIIAKNFYNQNNLPKIYISKWASC